MGKTRDTGFLGNCVFTDSSNNVGIGAAASGSYKFQVTGTTNLTSDLTVNGLTVGKGAASIVSNTVVGLSALPVNTTGTLNTAIGNSALLTNTTGYGNTSVGYSAIGYNTTGFFNAAVGVNALLFNSTGTYNNALGTAALYANTTGSYNTAVGQQAGTANTTGSNNTYIGYASGFNITTGSNNTIIGAYYGTAAMANNIVLADGAGNVRYQWDGTNNVFGNPLSGTSATFSGQVAIGVTPSAWDTITNIQIKNASLGGFFGNTYLGANTYYASGGWKYISTDFANRIEMQSGKFEFYTAPSGTAGNAITFTKVLDIASTGAATFSNSVTTPSITNGGQFKMDYGANAASRSWRLISDSYNFGDFSIQQSTTQSGSTYADRLLISASGNVGIGTSSPSNPEGFLRVLNISGGDAALVLSNSNGTAKNWSLGAYSSGSFNITDGNTPRLSITSGGNVGIGAADSIVKLNIVGASATSSNFAFYVTNSTPSPMFFIRNDGYMSFGLEANSPYNIAQSGRTCILASNGSVGYLSSTRESKTNIENLSDISWLYQLNPVSFNYRKKDDENNYTNQAEDDKWYGLIADEVEIVNEDLVFYKTKEDKTKELAGVEYNKLIAALVKSVQELKAEIEAQQQQINSLKHK